MGRDEAHELVSLVYAVALRRTAEPTELAHWVAQAMNGMSPSAMLDAFRRGDEFQSQIRVRCAFPSGHYHNPVVDPEAVSTYVARERETAPDRISGIALNLPAMRDLWLRELAYTRTTPFTDTPCAANRYDYTGGPYPWGDAIALRMMLHHFRPERVVEIGSGYSTACLLDSAEHANLTNFAVTCVEPDPVRLKALLRPGDWDRVTLLRSPVQEISPTIVDSLQADDILLIDSTHVLKTGSDVHYELFHLLPRLAPGVLVHVHDIGYPFEYPDQWIFKENFSWNEAYALRAFLMYNQAFRVLFWNAIFAGTFARELAAEYPIFLRNPGSAIWLRRAF